MSTLPRTQLARSSVVGSTAMKIGIGKLRTKAKRRFLSDNQHADIDQQQQDDEAEILFKAITQLRGTAVKLAQVLGMETELLPERIRTELAKSYHQVPPLNRVLVAKVIQEELGDRPSKLFKSFEPVAFAAASLGQVHRAVLNDGTPVAVKVQYPGIHVTIESDLKLLRKLMPGALKLLPQQARPTKIMIDDSIAEIAARLREETDYRIEANHTRWFSEHLQVEGVRVPRVFDEYSSSRVLTSELLDGLHIDNWLDTNPSQTVRNKAAQRMQTLFVSSILDLKKIHADPNPGNYLFQPDGTVAIIDFGCVKSFSDQFVDNIPKLLSGFCERDFKKIMSAYEAIGTEFPSDEDVDFESALEEFHEWLAKPFLVDRFDFKENQNYSSQAYALIHKLSDVPTVTKMHEDFIFFERTSQGLFKMFEKLAATVSMRSGWSLPPL